MEKKIEVVFDLKKIEVAFHLKKKIEVVFQMESAQLVEQVLQSKFCCKNMF